MPLQIKPKHIDSAMTTDAELSTEAALRQAQDTSLQNNLNSEISNRQNADNNLQSQVNSLSSELNSEENARIAADSGIQSQVTAHNGVGGDTHPLATQALAGFMSAPDKIKLDNALGRIVFPLIVTPTAASNTTFTAIGASFVWMNSTNDKVKSCTLRYMATLSNRNMQLRIVNVDTSEILGTSEVITATGYYSLNLALPTADCRIGLQALKSSSGGVSPVIEAIQLAFETI